MALLSSTVIFVLVLPYVLAAPLTEKQRDRLDRIEELLRWLQREIEHMKAGDHGERNANDTLTEDQTTEIRGFSVTSVAPDLPTTILSKTTAFDVRETTSDQKNDVTVSQAFSTAPPAETYHMTTQEKKVSTEGKIKEGKEKEQEQDQEEKDLSDVVSVRQLIEEGEDLEHQLQKIRVRHLIEEGEDLERHMLDLERQLQGIFLKLRTLNECVAIDEKCGSKHDPTKCCKGLKCSERGKCELDCVATGESCAANYFCCSGTTCTSVTDNDGTKKHICQ